MATNVLTTGVDVVWALEDERVERVDGEMVKKEVEYEVGRVEVE